MKVADLLNTLESLCNKSYPYKFYYKPTEMRDTSKYSKIIYRVVLLTVFVALLIASSISKPVLAPRSYRI